MIALDGAHGEGGGQVLRSALTLSMITGQPFSIVNVRAGRARPGLMRQHLAAVQAAAKIGGAVVQGAELGSHALTFTPGELRGGDYEIAIGSAGSCTLLLQTGLPALRYADAPATLRISGGTHNPMAPPAQFLQRSYLPLLAKMGGQVGLELLRSGFYPAGGGVLAASVQPCARLHPIDLVERGAPVESYAESVVASIRRGVAQRELDVVRECLGWETAQLHLRALPADQGPGNVLLLTLVYQHVTEVVAACGEKFIRAEDVAGQAVRAASAFLSHDGAVGEHLADQLMLPLALAGGGSFSCAAISDHMRTNAEVIARFLPVRFTFTPAGSRQLVTVVPTAAP
jgi:RNA 3'-terminal phosphate cyclase (ATP)